MKKFLLYFPAVIVLMLIVFFGQGNGSFLGIKAAFGYGGGSSSYGGYSGSSSVTPTPVTPSPAPVMLPAIPINPTVSDIQNTLTAITQQLVYIQANVTSPNAPALLAEVFQKFSELRSAINSVALVSGSSSAVPPSGSYTIPLSFGLKNNDVVALQNFLKSQGTEIYPEGLVTGYFGALTKAAVIKFQLKYNIVSGSSDPGSGFVGPKTRAKINELLGISQ